MAFPSEVFSSPSSLVSSLAGVLDISLDILVVGGVFLAVFLYALFSSKKTMVASLFALIFTGFLFLMFPYWSLIETQSGAPDLKKDIFLRLGVLAGIFLAVRFAIGNSVRGYYGEDRVYRWADLFGLSLAGSALLLMYGYRFTSLSELYPLSPEIVGFLTAPQAFFWWLAGSFAVVYLFSD